MALTSKQEKYVQGLVAGLSQREAYKRAYDASRMKTETIDKRASETFQKGAIRGRYNELMDEHKQKALWTRENAVNELLFLLEHSKQEIQQNGLDASNKGAFVDAVKELNKLERVYGDTDLAKANTEYIKAKTSLIKGVEHDTALMQTLLDVLKGNDEGVMHLEDN